MFRKFMLAGVFVGASVLATANAFANHCPSDVEAINAALETAEISEDQRVEVIELRDQGAAQHEAGNHDQSLESLHEALEILGVEHQ